MIIIPILSILSAVIIGIFSYGFIDPGFLLPKGSLQHLVYEVRPVATLILLLLLGILSFCYIQILRYHQKIFSSVKRLFIFLVIIGCIFAVSYPALSYDLFNYITTAKLTFTYQENPYVVMPIEIPNEPYLAFTRAANKLALYGPVWIAITSLPHFLGAGNIWLTIIAFKLLNAIAWILFSYIVYRVTKSIKNVIFFALNPLILIEVLIGGHNDIYMMILALLGFLLWNKKDVKSKIIGIVLFVSSWLIKGATIILTPLLFFRKLSLERLLLTTYYLLLVVFLVVAPIREELYPWYAVWLIAIASLLPLNKHSFLTGFTIIFSFALELRHLPYMWMGYYEGPGPMLRLLLTVIPVTIYIFVYIARKYLKKTV